MCVCFRRTMALNSAIKVSFCAMALGRILKSVFQSVHFDLPNVMIVDTDGNDVCYSIQPVFEPAKCAIAKPACLVSTRFDNERIVFQKQTSRGLISLG